MLLSILMLSSQCCCLGCCWPPQYSSRLGGCCWPDCPSRSLLYRASSAAWIGFFLYISWKNAFYLGNGKIDRAFPFQITKIFFLLKWKRVLSNMVTGEQRVVSFLQRWQERQDIIRSSSEAMFRPRLWNDQNTFQILKAMFRWRYWNGGQCYVPDFEMGATVPFQILKWGQMFRFRLWNKGRVNRFSWWICCSWSPACWLSGAACIESRRLCCLRRRREPGMRRRGWERWGGTRQLRAFVRALAHKPSRAHKKGFFHEMVC